WPLALLLVVGCGPTEPKRSADLTTSEIELYALIRRDGGLAQVFVTPTQGEGGDSITLSGGDALLAAADGGPDQALAPFEDEYVGQSETSAVECTLTLPQRGAQ